MPMYAFANIMKGLLYVHTAMIHCITNSWNWLESWIIKYENNVRRDQGAHTSLLYTGKQSKILIQLKPLITARLSTHLHTGNLQYEAASNVCFCNMQINLLCSFGFAAQHKFVAVGKFYVNIPLFPSFLSHCFIIILRLAALAHFAYIYARPYIYIFVILKAELLKLLNRTNGRNNIISFQMLWQLIYNMAWQGSLLNFN